MTDKEIFKDLCYGRKHKIPQSLQPKVSMVTPLNATCRYCKKDILEEEFDINVGYWVAVWYPVHKGCAAKQKEEDAYECQKIDADCNDCKYFDRTKQEGSSQPLSRELFPRIQGQTGYCLQRQCLVIASSNHCSNFPCFVHRKN